MRKDPDNSEITEKKSKFTTLKSRFLHEKIIFFIQIFFLTRYESVRSIAHVFIVGCSIRHRYAAVFFLLPKRVRILTQMDRPTTIWVRFLENLTQIGQRQFG